MRFVFGLPPESTNSNTFSITQYYRRSVESPLTNKVSVSKTFMMPCMEHHSFPCTFSNFVTGLVTVPIERQCDELVFQTTANTNG